jgi:hypothetical protein
LYTKLPWFEIGFTIVIIETTSIITVPISTVNITGFFTRYEGLSLTNEERIASFTKAGSNNFNVFLCFIVLIFFVSYNNLKPLPISLSLLRRGIKGEVR